MEEQIFLILSHLYIIGLSVFCLVDLLQVLQYKFFPVFQGLAKYLLSMVLYHNMVQQGDKAVRLQSFCMICLAYFLTLHDISPLQNLKFCFYSHMWKEISVRIAFFDMTDYDVSNKYDPMYEDFIRVRWWYITLRFTGSLGFVHYLVF